MKVLRSNHQNLLRVSKGLAASACSEDLLPHSVRVFVHRVANRVDLFPAFAPLVRISLLRAHVDNLQLVSPFPRIFLLVLDAVTLDCPLPGALPFHHSSADICCHEHDKLLATTKPQTAIVHAFNCCLLVSS